MRVGSVGDHRRGFALRFRFHYSKTLEVDGSAELFAWVRLHGRQRTSERLVPLLRVAETRVRLVYGKHRRSIASVQAQTSSRTQAAAPTSYSGNASHPDSHRDRQ